MKNKLTIHQNNQPIYHIIFDTSFQSLMKHMDTFDIKNKRLCIVTESNVAPLYLTQVEQLIKPHCKEVIHFVFQAGEKHKNLNTVSQLYEALIQGKFDRNDMLVALGGGVVGDLTGFAAATYLRGMDFIQIPTSLLAQVDSSIGGKTGVDFDSYKNMVGAFHQPKLVYINIDTLNTLNSREYHSGLGEIIKHGLIKDQEYYQFVVENKEKIKQKNQEVVLQMIYRSCQIKGTVVEHDPMEKGERALLNFGHTLGHSIEKLINFQYLHGECVAIGSILAGILSYHRNSITGDELDGLISLFDYFDFPVLPKSLDVNQIVADTKLDKKMDSGTIKFILLNKIGEAVIDRTVTDAEMIASVDQYWSGVYR